MAKDEHLPWLVVETAAPDNTKTIKNHFCSQMDDHLRIRVLAPVQKEEDGEPFADVLHQNAAWWTPVCKHENPIISLSTKHYHQTLSPRPNTS